MWRKSRPDPKQDLIDRLRRQAETWDKLAAAARQREDDGPANSLRECRPYPPGYWTGMAYGLETAARELRDVITQIEGK